MVFLLISSFFTQDFCSQDMYIYFAVFEDFFVLFFVFHMYYVSRM